jgi:hypothetical protein
MTSAQLRLNNPFDLSIPFPGSAAYGGVRVGLPGQPGAASFPTMELGFQAGIARIEQYVQNGYNGAPGDTITNLNAYYAQDQNWQNNVSYWSGIPKNQQLDPNNPTQMAALAYGILKAENVNNPGITMTVH